MAFEFKHKVHEETYGKVKDYLRELFGEMAYPRDDAPVFLLTMGSAAVRVAVIPWGEDEATVNTRAWVISGAEITPELMRFLLKANDDFVLGAFGLDDDDDIFFEYAILGSGCDKEEVRHCIMAVLTTADRFDDEIKSRFGGMTARDRAK